MITENQQYEPVRGHGLKDPVRKHTEELLSKFVASCDKCQCYLINDQRLMYVLQVREVRDSECEVLLQAPGGRSRPLDLDANWQLTLKLDMNVARLMVDHLESEGDCIRVILHPEVMVFMPRSTVRLDAESRSPVYVTFEASHFAMEGEMMDFSLGGARLAMDANPELKEGDCVYKMKFYLRGIRFFFPAARIAHIERCRDKWLLGVAFDEVSASLLEDLDKVIQSYKERRLDHFISLDG